jgi:hypothetical protein
MSHLSPIDVDLYFEKYRIYIRVLGQSRRYQAPSSAVVRELTSLPAKFFPSSIANFVEPIRPKIQVSAILSLPIAGLEVVASVVGTEWRHIQNFKITVYLGHANTRIQNV